MTIFQAEMKVGQLCRNGVIVHYAYSLNGYIESYNKEYLILQLLKEMD